MYGNPISPIDRTAYVQDPSSSLLNSKSLIGDYVYVVDELEQIWIAYNCSHQHPKVLGSARSVLYAGEMRIEANGEITELNNLSGTFRCQSKQSLCCVASQLASIGFIVHGVFWFPPDGSTAPKRLVCGRSGVQA